MKLWTKIRTVCADISPNCRQAARAQSELLDHPLPSTRRFGLWMHLLICKWCRRYGKQLRFMQEAAHQHEKELVEAAPQKLSAEARERIKQRLQNAGSNDRNC